VTTWLVTGGAGYIGSHVVLALRSSGRDVVVLDDFSAGLDRRVPDGVPVIRADVHDRDALAEAFGQFEIDVPLYYYRENVDGLLAVLESMQAAGVGSLVYSSSAAVYGTPTSNPVDESAALTPESPYGETKVVGEWLARDCGIAWGLSWAALRYFNVAGAGSDNLGDNSVNNLIPMVFRALDRGQRPQVFGDDYPTPDGTCIRDYIHVLDLAGAHVAAAQRCEQGASADAFNVGRGVGSSVREVMDEISAVLGLDIRAEVVGRRPGDPPATFASTERIEQQLGWRSSHDLREMVTSAWSAWRAHATPPPG
jgi:UDP-glucose 4-epimerase